MNPDVLIGLRIGAIGLGVTFLALGLLSFVMRWLLRLFPPASAVDEKPVVVPTEGEDEQRLEEMAVALAVGISLLEGQGTFDQRDPSLGKLLES